MAETEHALAGQVGFDGQAAGAFAGVQAATGADLGSLAPGKVADLVVLGADPLADIRNTRKVERVMLRGQLMSPDSIRAAW